MRRDGGAATAVPPAVDDTPVGSDAPVPTTRRVGRGTWLVAAVVVLVSLPEPSFDVGGAAFTLADVMSGLLVVVAVLGLLERRYTLPRPAAVVFGAVALAAVVSTMVAVDTSTALSGLVRYLQLFVLVPLAALVVVRTRREFAVVGGAFLVIGGVEGAVGVFQYLTGTGASYGGESVRAVGTFGPQEIMSMSVVISFALLVAAACAIAARDLRTRLLFTAGAVTLLVPLSLSLSRGSWLATALALLLMVTYLGLRRIGVLVLVVLAAATVALGGFGLGGGEVGDRLGSVFSSVSSPDSSVGDRYYLWDTAGSIWREHPLAGAGMRSFPEQRDEHAPLGLSSASDTDQPGVGFVRQPLLSPHNQYMLVLAEQGLLGVLALAGMLGAIVVAAVGRLRRDADPRTAAIGLAAGGLVIWQSVQFLYSDTGGPTSVLTAVLIGVAAGYAFGAPARRTPPPAVVPPAPVAAAPAGIGSRSLGTATSTVDAPPVDDTPIVDDTSPAGSGSPDSPPAGAAGGGRRGGESRLVMTAAAVSAVLTALGAFGGIVRDLMLASYFGADGTTDAFLVAWTVAESAVPLLIDTAMALLLVPAFTRALAADRDGFLPGSGSGRNLGSAVSEVAAYMLPRIVGGLAVIGAVVFVGAPWLVPLLAPGLAAPELGVEAMRIVAGSLVLIGIAGFLAGALRAHLVFGPPAAISLSFNIGIVGAIALLHHRLGVLSAAIGVTVGAGLMVAVQLPAYLRRLRVPRRVVRRSALISAGAFVPIAVFTLVRQAQVYVERYFGSDLAEGTISHLNYAQKIGQLPSTLALLIGVVTFPLLARSLVTGDEDEARRRLEIDVRIVGAVVLLSTTFLFVFAHRVVHLLFERGAFTAADTADTAAILRIYVLGLLGQALVQLIGRALFSGRSTFVPAVTMVIGLVVTAVVAGLGAAAWGAPGIAAGNAAGITVTAICLMCAKRAREAAVSPATLGATLLRLVPAVAATAVVGALLAGVTATSPDLVAVAAGGVTMMLVFAGVAMATGGLPSPRSLLGKGSSS